MLAEGSPRTTVDNFPKRQSVFHFGPTIITPSVDNGGMRSLSDIRRRGFEPLVGLGLCRNTAHAQLSFPRTTFIISCRNSAGSARTRVTFQIVPSLNDSESTISSGSSLGTDSNGNTLGSGRESEDSFSAEFRKRFVRHVFPSSSYTSVHTICKRNLDKA